MCQILSVMYVAFKIQLRLRFLFAALGWGSLWRIKDIGTPLFVGFMNTDDILFNVLL